MFPRPYFRSFFTHLRQRCHLPESVHWNTSHSNISHTKSWQRGVDAVYLRHQRLQYSLSEPDSQVLVPRDQLHGVDAQGVGEEPGLGLLLGLVGVGGAALVESDWRGR